MAAIWQWALDGGSPTSWVRRHELPGEVRGRHQCDASEGGHVKRLGVVTVDRVAGTAQPAQLAHVLRHEASVGAAAAGTGRCGTARALSSAPQTATAASSRSAMITATDRCPTPRPTTSVAAAVMPTTLPTTSATCRAALLAP